MRVGAVVLTTGERPDELASCLASIGRQRGVDCRLLVVLNRDSDVAERRTSLAALVGPALAGTATDDASDRAVDGEVLEPGENLGIPAGRNRGVAQLDDVDLVLFLDDDAVLSDRDTLARAAAWFTTDPQLAVLSLRLIDPATGRTARRHVPRLRVGDVTRSSWATTFLGGASIIRRSAYLEAGGLPDEFFYAHEETSLAWRLIDRGWRIRYQPDLTVEHPVVAPTRHGQYHQLSARNRVLLARRHLPFVLGAWYVANWTVLSLLRARRGHRAILRGVREGLSMRDIPRDRISWAAVARMTRLGRPPII